MSLLGGCLNRKPGAKPEWDGKNIRGGMRAVFLILLLFFGAVFSQEGEKSRAAVSVNGGMTDIRVGLAALYADKTEIKISNTRIGLGYCINDSYQTDLEFASSTGFVFTPANGFYYSLAKTYASYASAERAAAVIRNLGVSAWPVAIYRNYWRVYVGGTKTAAQAEEVYAKIKDRYGYSYSVLMSDNAHRVFVQADGYSFLIDGEQKKAYPQFKVLDTDGKGNAVFDLGSRRYRGRIEIGCYGKKSVTAVNIINIESYLYGVVPCEMQAGYHAEALKVQAVCARSFALMKVGYRADSNISRAYYLEDTTKSQVYRGYGAEDSRTNRAVDATRGEAVYYEGKMVPTYYFSTSGGSTENVSEVWGMGAGYLKAVPDLYETEPEKQPWLVTYTNSDIKTKLEAKKLSVGTVQAVIPQVMTATGRVYLMKVRGSGGNSILQAGTIREVFSLPSTKFKVVKQGDVPDMVTVQGKQTKETVRIGDCYVLSAGGTVAGVDKGLSQYIVAGADNLMNYPRSAPESAGIWYFYGMGYGHGVGMSQSGANGMAKAGYGYREIISYYYSGATVGQVGK
ncbi:MAG: SpoIID/LytB domain-containing protein [Lachnospiraceae bacterium]|nr:SpoIID/LytB domain-containing protein [Lachnospiraceae bacterium]